MKTKMLIVSAGVIAALGLSATTAHAEPPEGDVFLEVVNGELRTGLISEDGLTITRGVRVHFAPLGLDVPNVIDEPGFQSEPGGLGSLTNFSFNIRKALRKWTGTDFSLTPAETMTTASGPLSVTSPASDVLTTGLTFAVDPTGSHDHPDFILNAPATDGVYLLELEFAGSGVTTSEPVWMLFGQNATSADVDAAYAWATANIPSPGAGAVLALVGVLASRRRR